MHYKGVIQFWLLGLLLAVSVSLIVELEQISKLLVQDLLLKTLTPLIICFACIKLFFDNRIWGAKYLLFFFISITSILGVSETLTGSHAESSNALLYGLSFYTASLAFYLTTQSNHRSLLWSAANPLLLSTGPIAIFVKNIKYKKLQARYNYYLPFIILGLFLHQAVATPLTETFFLLEKTDVLSVLAFSVIFELFVYANFCGLSLIIYGVSGLLGYRIPLNFRQPFSSTNIIEFWKGWHISLSTVLKALFYRPVRARFSSGIAVLAVFMASAMWHGVTLNFLLWGGFHAVIFALTISLLKKQHRLVSFFILIIAVVFGRMLFSDANTDRLLVKLSFSYEGFESISSLRDIPNTTKLALFLAILFTSAEFFFRKRPLFVKRNYKFYRIPYIQVLLLIIMFLTLTTEVGIDYAVYGQR